MRQFTGFADSLSATWAETSGTRQHAPAVRILDKLWSWVDRIASINDGAYTWTARPDNNGSRAEFVSVSARSASFPHSDIANYVPFLPYRNGAIIYEKLTLAKKLHPYLLYIGNWNHFVASDSGFSDNTTEDIEPTASDSRGWGWRLYNERKTAIAQYRDYETGGSGRPARITDITARGLVGGGETLLLGFTISGTTGQRFIFKGLGASLANWLPNDHATAPTLWLVPANGGTAANNGWAAPGDYSSITAGSSLGDKSGFPNSSAHLLSLNYGLPLNSTEPAITAQLGSGTHLAFLEEPSSTTSNIGHLRAFGMDEVSDTRITQASIRGRVEDGNRVMIIGFHIDRTMKISLRGSGPSLAQFLGSSTVLADPELALFDSSGNQIGYCGNVGDDQELKSKLDERYGSWQTTNMEAGMIVTLEPGDYTVHLRRQSGASGIGHIDLQVW